MRKSQLARPEQNVDTSNLMKVVAVIPARLASTRLPRKMLREINGRPLVVCVYEAVRSSSLLDDVIIAADSDEILDACRKRALDLFVSLPESSLERAERLEQLRFLENGIPIFVAETPFDSIGVDTEEEFARVEKVLRQN